MKKIGLGIAIILFAICLELSHNGHLAYITWGIGAIGLITISLLSFAELNRTITKGERVNKDKINVNSPNNKFVFFSFFIRLPPLSFY